MPSYAVTVHRGADMSIAQPTSRCILFDGENISFDASLVIYVCVYIYVCVCVCVCVCMYVYTYRVAHEKPALRLVDQRGRRSRTLHRKLNKCKCKVLTG